MQDGKHDHHCYLAQHIIIIINESITEFTNTTRITYRNSDITLCHIILLNKWDFPLFNNPATTSVCFFGKHHQILLTWELTATLWTTLILYFNSQTKRVHQPITQCRIRMRDRVLASSDKKKKKKKAQCPCFPASSHII